jgi:hypothetical protein
MGAAMSVQTLLRRSLQSILLGACVLASTLLSLVGAGAQAEGSKPAIFDGATWYLRSSLTSGVATSTFRYGRPGDLPVMGDWDGDGHDTVGVVRFTGPSGGPFTYTWYLRNTNSAGPANVTPFVFGDVRFVAVDELGTIPVVGDWNDDGIDTAGVMLYDADIAGPIQWWLRNTNSAGPPDVVLNYGRGRDGPIAGDWNGDGRDTVGVVRGPTGWLLRNSNTSGVAEISFNYGSAQLTELAIVGDWNGDGTYTPAVLRNRPPTDESGGFEHWLFRNSNTAGAANGQIIYGSDAQEVGFPIDVTPRLSWR